MKNASTSPETGFKTFTLDPEEVFTSTGNLPREEAQKRAVSRASGKNLHSFAFDFKGAGKTTSRIHIMCTERNEIPKDHPQLVQLIPNTTYAIVRSRLVS